MITAGSSAVGPLAAAKWARHRGAGEGGATTVAVLALDLVGGAYVNNTRASVWWYEREGQGEAEHLTFAALHVHPLLVAAVDRRVDARDRWVRWGLVQYGYMLASTVAIRALPAHRRRLGVVLTAGGLVLGRSTVAPWFAWTYYPKLLLGHAAASLWPDEDLDVAGQELSS